MTIYSCISKPKGNLNVTYPIRVQKNDNYGGLEEDIDLKQINETPTTHLTDHGIDFQKDASFALQGNLYAGTRHDFYVDVKIPKKGSPYKNGQHRLIIFFTTSGTVDMYEQMKHSKVEREKDFMWLQDTSYIVSISYKTDASKSRNSYHRPHKKHLYDILSEFGRSEMFTIKERIFVLGHSRGSMAALDALILLPKFTNNYLLSAPYFQEAPGGKSNNKQILFNATRQHALFHAINSNENLRIQVIIANRDDYRNSCYALCFFLRGNFKNLQVLEVQGNHDDSLRRLAGNEHQESRIRVAAKQVDTELYQGRNIVGERFNRH